MRSAVLQSSPLAEADLRGGKEVLHAVGLGTALAGALGIVSWHTHWTTILQLTPGAPSVKYNTAVSFVLLGVAAAALPGRYSSWAVRCAGAVVAIAFVTVLEYLLAIHTSFDELVVKAYLPDGSIDPGRMSPLAQAMGGSIGFRSTVGALRM